MSAGRYLIAIDVLRDLVALKEIKARMLVGIATPEERARYELKDMVWARAKLAVARLDDAPLRKADPIAQLESCNGCAYCSPFTRFRRWLRD